jgi:hypothetical protein
VHTGEPSVYRYINSFVTLHPSYYSLSSAVTFNPIFISHRRQEHMRLLEIDRFTNFRYPFRNMFFLAVPSLEICCDDGHQTMS